MKASERQWYAGVAVGSRTVRVVYVQGYNAHDVMVDGECVKRLLGGEAEAFRRAELARQLYAPERPLRVMCQGCQRVVGVTSDGRVHLHNSTAPAPGHRGVPCPGSGLFPGPL